MDRRAQLVEALYNAEAEIKMYKDLLQKAEQSKATIQRELEDSRQPENSVFNAGQVRDARQGILRVLAQAKANTNRALLAPREITDALYELPSDLVLRELHKLAKDSRSDVCWNGRMGSASRYART